MSRFEPVAVRRRLVGKCPVCGKRSARSRKIEQTVNPFHPAVLALPGDSLRPGDVPDHHPTYADAYAAVLAAVEREADAWEPDFTHADCEVPR